MDELAADSGILPGHSAFTSALLAGLLSEADTNDDGLITASELADYVTPRVSRETMHQGGQGQTPFFNYLMGSEQGNFVFFLPDKPTPPQEIVTSDGFLYIGKGLTIEGFKEYVLGFDFGSAPPHAIVLGHTINPWTLEARVAGQPPEEAWNSGERLTKIYDKRRIQLERIMQFLKAQRGYDRGPHLYIDDRYIWLFTPMNVLGYHSASGNQYDGRHSIGIRIIGNFNEVQPSGPQWKNTKAAMGILAQCLSIPIEHRPFAAGISFHRDYQEDRSSPGAAVSNEWVIEEVRQWVEANPIHRNDT